MQQSRDRKSNDCLHRPNGVQNERVHVLLYDISIYGKDGSRSWQDLASCELWSKLLTKGLHRGYIIWDPYERAAKLHIRTFDYAGLCQ